MNISKFLQAPEDHSEGMKAAAGTQIVIPALM
jgi:hypothetical protein